MAAEMQGFEMGPKVPSIWQTRVGLPTNPETQVPATEAGEIVVGQLAFPEVSAGHWVLWQWFTTKDCHSPSDLQCLVGEPV